MAMRKDTGPLWLVMFGGEWLIGHCSSFAKCIHLMGPFTSRLPTDWATTCLQWPGTQPWKKATRRRSTKDLSDTRLHMKEQTGDLCGTTFVLLLGWINQIRLLYVKQTHRTKFKYCISWWNFSYISNKDLNPNLTSPETKSKRTDTLLLMSCGTLFKLMQQPFLNRIIIKWTYVMKRTS